MVRFWYLRVKRGKAALEDVPALWHDAVAKMLAADGAEG